MCKYGHIDVFELSVCVNAFFSSQCSVDCGVGKRVRSVRCVSNHGNTVNDRECNDRLRPQRTEDCHMGPCVTNWYFTDWTNTVSIDSEMLALDLPKGHFVNDIFMLRYLLKCFKCGFLFLSLSVLRRAGQVSCGERWCV